MQTITFCRYYQKDLDVLSKLDQTYTKEFDEIIEKGMHFELAEEDDLTHDSLFTMLNFPKNFAEVSYKPSKKDFSYVPRAQSQNVQINASLSERVTAAIQDAAAAVAATGISSSSATPTDETIIASPRGSPTQQEKEASETPPGLSEDSPANDSLDDADYSEEETVNGDSGKETIATPKKLHWKKRRRMQNNSETEVVLAERYYEHKKDETNYKILHIVPISLKLLFNLQNM